MNFHKTIGFLAALLLTLGIGVPDSFAQEEVSSMTLTVSPRTLRDSTTANSAVVTVTARLTVNVANTVTVTGGQNVSVNVAVSTDATTTALGTDDVSYVAAGDGAQQVNVPENSSRGTATVSLSFTMSHDDDSVDEEVTVTATVAAADAVGTDDLVRTAKLTVTDHSASLVRDAASARGYQVHLTAPSATGTARAVKDAVKVQVRRKRGLGADFGAFTSIKVALRNRNAKGDADDPVADLYSLTITDAVELGTLVLPRVRTDELLVPDAGLAGNASEVPPTTLHTNNNDNNVNNKAYYTRGSDYDILEFRFHPSGGGDYDKLYALVVFNAVAEGGATATIDLSEDNDLILSSLDTDISIYPADPASFSGQMVGNGRTAKIDAGAPGTGIVSAIAIEIDGEAVPVLADATTDTADDLIAAGYTAGVGQKIKISVTMVDFGEHSLVLQILGRDIRAFNNANDVAVNVTAANQVITGHNFTPIGAVEVLRAVSQDRPVVVEVPVTAGKFKRQANLNKHPIAKDPRFVDKNGFYEDDEVVVRIRAQVKDRAGNAGNQAALSPAFVLDSRLPKVEITYPKPSGTDSTRFTAATTQDYTFLDGGGGVADLKPLNFKVDEKTMAAYVVINEDTLTVAHDEDAPLAEVSGGYDLTPEGGYVLKNPDENDDGEAQNDHPVEDSKQGGKAVKLQAVVKDRVGNTGVGTPDGGDAIFDAVAPEVTIVFPTNDILESLGNKIGGDDNTQDPIFTVNEATDSIVVRYVSSERTVNSILPDGSSKVDENIQAEFMGDDALVEDEAYDLQIYVRDLAGHIGISDSDPDTDGAQAEQDLIFESGFMNPQASEFKIVTQVRNSATEDTDMGFAKVDSVLAGQAMRLDITAMDATQDKAAVAYRTSGVKVVAMDSNGDPVSSVSFWGDGVDDNEDGTATLNGPGWAIGKRMVSLMAEKAGDYTVAVKELDDAGVAQVMGTADIVVDAAEFSDFNITILENNVEVKDIRGAFQLSVMPTDKFGNVSVKAYKTAAIGDSLDLLDSRVAKKGVLYDNGIRVTIESFPVISAVPTIPIRVVEGGRKFTIAEPPAADEIEFYIAVVDRNLDADDTRSEGVNASAIFAIKSALMPELTLWVPNVDGDQAGNDVTIPKDADDITVTVNAEDYEAGSMVTFTKDGTAMDAEAANDDGTASLMITMSEAGDVTVSATDGRYETGDLTITFVVEPDEPTRVKHWADADMTDPVYLVYDQETGPPDYTVGRDDIMALVASYGATKGQDDHYNVQADTNDDDTVSKDPDLYNVVGSYGKTDINAPASKPLVLVPGINENAEFSLSLGSERVIAGELVAVDVSLANVEAVMGYGFALNYEVDKFEFVSVAQADEDLLRSTGGETVFHHIVADGQIEVVTGMYNGTAVSGGGDVVRFVFRVLREFEDNARFEIAEGVVFDPSQLQNPVVVAGVLELQSTPREFALHQNFPNPFNPDTTIKYDLAESSDVTLQIYNVLGQVVRTLVASEAQDAGRYQIRWNGMDDRGVPVSSGVYFYQISAEGKFHQVQKLMLLK